MNAKRLGRLLSAEKKSLVKLGHQTDAEKLALKNVRSYLMIQLNQLLR